jgi:hypothetical protein
MDLRVRRRLKSADLNRSWGFKSPSGHHKINNLHEINCDLLLQRLHQKLHWRPRPFSSRLTFDEHQQGAFRYLKELNGIISCPRGLSTISGTQTLRSKLKEVRRNEEAWLHGRLSGLIRRAAIQGIEAWMTAAGIEHRRLLRSVSKSGKDQPSKRRRHYSAITSSGFKSLQEGQAVQFQCGKGAQGLACR